MRLWRSKPYFADDEASDDDQSVDPDDIVDRIDKMQDGEYLTSIYYPNTPGQVHKEERLKQEYFYSAATLQDLMRRFKKDIMFQMHEFYEKNQILLNELHSAVSILEMLRILIDDENLTWQQAWNTTHYTFSCAIYVTTHKDFEQWPIHIFKKVLPRHYLLIETIDQLLKSQIKKTFKDKCSEQEVERKVGLMTIIDQKSNMVRLANLCFVSCFKVIFSSELQKEILLGEKDSPLTEYYHFVQKSFMMIEPGVNPRKWIHNCNRNLSKLITDHIDDESEWLTHLQLLKPILSQINEYKITKNGKTTVDEKSFFFKFLQVRQGNKMRLIRHLQRERKDPSFLADFDLKKTCF